MEQRSIHETRALCDEVKAIEALYFDYLSSARRFENDVGTWTKDFDDILAEDQLHGDPRDVKVPALSRAGGYAEQFDLRRGQFGGANPTNLEPTDVATTTLESRRRIEVQEAASHPSPIRGMGALSLFRTNYPLKTVEENESVTVSATQEPVEDVQPISPTPLQQETYYYSSIIEAARRAASVDTEMQTDPVQLVASSSEKSSRSSSSNSSTRSHSVANEHKTAEPSPVFSSTSLDRESPSKHAETVSKLAEVAGSSNLEEGSVKGPLLSPVAPAPKSHPLLHEVTKWYLDNDPDNVFLAASKVHEYTKAGKEDQLLGDLRRWKDKAATSDRLHETTKQEQAVSQLETGDAASLPIPTASQTEVPRGSIPSSEMGQTLPEADVPQELASEKQSQGTQDGSPVTVTPVSEPQIISAAAVRTPLERVTALYQKYDPAKVHLAKVQLGKHAGREEAVIKALVKKYGPEPDHNEPVDSPPQKESQPEEVPVQDTANEQTKTASQSEVAGEKSVPVTLPLPKKQPPPATKTPPAETPRPKLTTVQSTPNPAVAPAAAEDPFWVRAAEAALADGTWVARKDAKGRTFYSNKKEQKSCWNLAKELRTRAHSDVEAEKNRNPKA